jgi:hypothetical protein
MQRICSARRFLKLGPAAATGRDYWGMIEPCLFEAMRRFAGAADDGKMRQY